MPAPRFVGSEVKRLEDPRLLRGEAQYVDDLTPPGLVHAFVVRSPYAHAHVRGLATARARALPGVPAILTAADLADR
jgi:carbon-monoxide dehydrogenase large subunit